jgi:hypothetical protein
VILYVTIFGEHEIIFYVIILTIIFFTLKLITYNDGVNLLSKFSTDENKNQGTTFVSIKTLEQRIINLSISLYRASVFIITSVAIIAVDFKIFPRIHAKTNDFGLSLMDLGIFALI